MDLIGNVYKYINGADHTFMKVVDFRTIKDNGVTVDYEYYKLIDTDGNTYDMMLDNIEYSLKEGLFIELVGVDLATRLLLF